MSGFVNGKVIKDSSISILDKLAKNSYTTNLTDNKSIVNIEALKQGAGQEVFDENSFNYGFSNHITFKNLKIVKQGKLVHLMYRLNFPTVPGGTTDFFMFTLPASLKPSTTLGSISQVVHIDNTNAPTKLRNLTVYNNGNVILDPTSNSGTVPQYRLRVRTENGGSNFTYIEASPNQPSNVINITGTASWNGGANSVNFNTSSSTNLGQVPNGTIITLSNIVINLVGGGTINGNGFNFTVSFNTGQTVDSVIATGTSSYTPDELNIAGFIQGSITYLID